MKTFIRFGLASAAFWAASMSNGYAKDDVKVSEVMPCNISTYMVDQNYTGWLELQNSASSSVDLNGYKIDHYKFNKSNEVKFEWSWTVKDLTISEGGYKVICFDGSDMDSKNARKLDSNGGVVVLKDKSGAVVDSFVYLATQTHISYGIYDGVAGYMEPTPKKANTQSYPSLNNRCVSPYFDGAQPGVQQNGDVTVRIKTKTQGATIYYTTNGSEPTKASSVYDANKGISVGSSNAVIRARAYKDGMISSPILTGSFIFVDSKHKSCGSNGFTLPIVSIVTDKANFYDAKIGIYVDGDGTYSNHAETSCLPDKKLNYIMDWTRPGNFEYIVNDQEVLNHEVDLAIMGGCSRQYEVKSLKIKAGNRMGAGNTKLKYDFFADKLGNEYKSLQLRNGGNGYAASNIRFRDGFMQSIAKPMNIDYQAYQPVAYYINGSYAGLMGLRERTNKAYIESNYGLDEDKIDVLEITNKGGVQATCGDKEAYNKMVSFLEKNDPKSEGYYEQAAKMIDMDEYIDYQIFEQFIVNTDWPGNNSKIWRSRNNGKFRWITFDTDFGLGLYGEGNNNNCVVSNNMIEWAAGTGSRYNWANGTNNGFTDDTKWKTTIFSHLIENPTFKERFINRYLIHLSTTFKYENIVATWDSIVDLVDKEYCAFSGKSVDDYYVGNEMLKFAKQRPDYIYSHLKKLGQYEDYVNLSVKSSAKDAHIMMNNELLPSSSLTSKYFKGKTVKLEAIAPAGYRFLGWKSGEESTTSTPSQAPVSVDTAHLSYTNTREWKYFTSEEGISTKDWRKLDAGFDDSDWLVGSGKMGYNDKDNSSYNTVIESGEKGNHYATVYFRSTFNIKDLSDIQAIVARITFDDGYALYVNGTKLETGNLTDTDPQSYIGSYANDSTVRVIIPKENLKEGTNLFAVEVHQHEAKSSDVTFIFEESVVNVKKENSNVNPSEYLSTHPILNVTVKGDMILRAVFEKTTDCVTPDIFINEICSSNNSNGGTSDDYGNYPDWFEVYNASSDTINLAGMYLTDKPAKQTKYMIPYGYEETKIAPKSRMVFWADGMPFLGPSHIGFKLENVDNASIGLNMDCGDDIVSVDYVNYMEMVSNKSYGHDADGSGNWIIFGDCENGKVYLPTPGKANSSNVCNSNECFATDVEDEIIGEIEQVAVTVYPVPTRDNVNVEVKNAESVNLFIYDNLGRLLQVYEKLNASSVVNMEAYAAGVYHFEIIAGGEVYKQTVIKE